MSNPNVMWHCNRARAEKCGPTVLAEFLRVNPRPPKKPTDENKGEDEGKGASFKGKGKGKSFKGKGKDKGSEGKSFKGKGKGKDF